MSLLHFWVSPWSVSWSRSNPACSWWVLTYQKAYLNRVKYRGPNRPCWSWWGSSGRLSWFLPAGYYFWDSSWRVERNGWLAHSSQCWDRSLHACSSWFPAIPPRLGTRSRSILSTGYIGEGGSHGWKFQLVKEVFLSLVALVDFVNTLFYEFLYLLALGHLEYGLNRNRNLIYSRRKFHSLDFIFFPKNHEEAIHPINKRIFEKIALADVLILCS